MSNWFIKKAFLAVVLRSLLLLLVISGHSAYASQTDMQAELRSYADAFNNTTFLEQRALVGPLEWSGISDPVLYDIVSAKIDELLEQGNKKSIKQASWYVRVLARSGNEKYRPQLTTLASDGNTKKLRQYAEKALQHLDLYQVWNPIIAKGLANATQGQLAEARVKNMLTADNPYVVRLGAKRVYYAHSQNAELLKLAHDKLLKTYQITEDIRVNVDAIGWLIKALAQSGDSQYEPTLQRIVKTANNKKIKKYAKKHRSDLSQ